MKNKTLIDSTQIESILIRISHEIVEKNINLDKVCIIGIRSRGDVLASRINELIRKQTSSKVKLGYIDVTFYRDDFLSNLGSHKIGPSSITFDINEKSYFNTSKCHNKRGKMQMIKFITLKHI